MQRHDGNLQRLVFILCKGNGTFGGTADGDGHVLWEDFLHAGGDANEHVARVKTCLGAGFRESNDGDGPFEQFRYAFQLIGGHDDILRRGLWIAQFGEKFILLAAVFLKQFSDHFSYAVLDGRRDVLRDELVESFLLFTDKREPDDENRSGPCASQLVSVS